MTTVDDAKGLLNARQPRTIPAQIANYLDRRVLTFLTSSTPGDASDVIVR